MTIDTLFEKLGGADVVAGMVAEMYENVLRDPELAPFFKNVDMQRLGRMQFEFLASALGGPVQYSGAELQAIHAGLGVTPHHFSKFVGHMASAMESRNIDPKLVDEMLGQIAMYRDRIVGSANVDG